jgi:hypothetical protein
MVSICSRVKHNNVLCDDQLQIILVLSAPGSDVDVFRKMSPVAGWGEMNKVDVELRKILGACRL